MISIFFNLLIFALYPIIWSILENVPNALEKEVPSADVRWSILYMSVKFIHSRVPSSVSSLVFCLDQQSTTFLTLCFCGRHFFHRWGGLFWDDACTWHLCALYFYYYYISPTSDHQALALRGWGPLVWTIYPLLSVEYWSPLLLFYSKDPTNDDNSAALFKMWLSSADLSLPSCFRPSILLETLLKHSLPDDDFTLGQTEPEVSEHRGREMFTRCWNLHIYIHVCVHQLFSHIQLCDPTNYSLPSSSAHGIFQARILEWLAIFPPPEDRPNSGIKPMSPMSSALQVDSLLAEPSGKPIYIST